MIVNLSWLCRFVWCCCVSIVIGLMCRLLCSGLMLCGLCVCCVWCLLCCRLMVGCLVRNMVVLMVVGLCNLLVCWLSGGCFGLNVCGCMLIVCLCF